MEIIISLLIFLVACFVLCKAIEKLNKAQNITVLKNSENESIIKEKEFILKEVRSLEKQRQELLSHMDREVSKIEQQLKNTKAQTDEAIRLYQQNYSFAAEQYSNLMETTYSQLEDDFDYKINNLNKQKEEISTEIKKLQNTLIAGVQAQLREKEKEDNVSFYKLQVTEHELSDIKTLNNVKSILFNPVILNKLIWTTFFQKQTTEMCNRILGLNKTCGIYKITNLLTEQCYIGQSVDVAQRWKDHIKCGLGIDASATNKLYKAMQEDGVWNFTFELMEKCPREELNEKERFWIEMYQSDKYSYNSTKGNK